MRTPRPSAVSDLTLPQLEQRRIDALRDIEELADQVELGEIDRATATRLRKRYERELAETEAALARSAGDLGQSTAADPNVHSRRSSRRSLAGAGLVLGLFTVAIFFIDDDSVPTQQGVAAGAANEAVAADPVDDPGWLAEMEEVAAANPGNVAFRLALADAYFQLLDYSPALSHYLGVLESDPNPSQRSEALGRIGWMAYMTDQLEAAEQYLRSSLAADPSNVESKLYLGYVLLYGFEDAAGAVPLLEEVLAFGGLTAEVRLDVENALATAMQMEADQ